MALDLKPLPPKDAIAYFRSKGLQPSFAWQDVWQDQHAQAFTVAKMLQVQLLEDTRAIVDQALAEGWTQAMFDAELAPRLKAAGWWGKQLMGDPDTGEVKLVQLGSKRRLKTIFQTNLRVAHQVGNWQRAWAVRATTPYMMFRHNSVRFPRLEHKAWDGTILPITDAWWDTHYPPCAWGCKCTTMSLSQAMLDQRKLKVTLKPVRFPPKAYVNPRTGEPATIEGGIDPGWNYNVGKAPLRHLTARPAPTPRGVKGLPADQAGPAARKFLEDLNLPADRPVVDPGGHPVVVNDGLFRDAAGFSAVPRPDLVEFLPQVAQTLRSPETVGWVWGLEERTAKIAVDLARVMAVATPGTDDRDMADLGPMPQWLITQAALRKIDLSKMTLRAHASEIRHSRKEHPDVKDEHYQQVPALVRMPEKVIYGLQDYRRQPAIAMIGEYNGERLVGFFGVRPGTRELVLKSLYRRRAGIDDLDLKELFRPYARDGGAADLDVDDMRGKIKLEQDFLLRRFVRRVDKRTINVDFAPSLGTWTYDVQDD
ncbi:F protein [Asticcacaulis biprosthecium C19]|uniref:F protein n=1 Tax=Asticcacaulis biprosthecium C19 TaxID=715226 RepID=F4QGA5_9CAUL|nr:phage minor head protein [Asticcacaulis biprosthecium]EGF92433.1 F protein [Asticcacaulis biprosthecium C19]